MSTALALQTYDIVTGGPGEPVEVFAWTNDDQDRGYPNDDAGWAMDFDTVEQALKHTGTSRVGISGVRVTVTLDGEKI